MCRTGSRVLAFGVLVIPVLAALAAPAPAEVPGSGPGSTPAPEYLARLGADRWHTAGVRGKGVKVAVLDTGFRGWRDQLGKTLPANVTARSFRRDENLEFRDSQHGILCGEVVHNVAPDAEILFANWEPGHEDQFLSAVRWAKEQGARVVSVSVIMPNWSDGQGGGEVHHALSDLLGSGDHSTDLACFASAGNTTERHWAGSFRDDGNGWHEWAAGKTDNGLRPWAGEDTVMVELYGRPGGAYELVVVDDTGREIGKEATDPELKDRLSAAVRFNPESGRSYRVRVRHVSGPAGEFHVTTTFGSLEMTTAGANVCFPGDGNEVVAVGAVDSEGHRQPYSACGTNLRAVKPDLSAVVPVPTVLRSRWFGGTSAACPQVAAVATLCLSRHPDWSPTRVREALRTAATDLGPPGPDPETGFGLVHVPAENLAGLSR
jgi:subtilisin family serine protease